ncbi:MAG: pentapeptide repeat-containing protein [Albidovulum sp.]
MFFRGVGRECWGLCSGVIRRFAGRAGFLATVLGLSSDIGTPWQDFLGGLALVTAVAAVAFLALRWLFIKSAESPGWTGRVHRSATVIGLNALVGAIVLGGLYLARQEFGGPNGLTAHYVPAIADFQNRMDDRFDRVDAALAVLTGTTEATRETVDGLSETVEETRDTVVEMNQTMEFSTALAIVDRVKEAKDGSNQGQARALAALVADGFDFVGTNFSGVSFRGAVLDQANFSEAVFHFADFRGASFQGAKLVKTGIRLALADGETNFVGADLSHSYGPLFEAPGADFSNARLVGTTFLAANLNGADFSGADLSGASLAFADLRGANLSGANLTGAHFVGTLLTGADLTGAVFGQTNMLAAVLDPALLTDTQRQGACRHQASTRNGVGTLKIVERWKSDRYGTGYEYDDLVAYDNWFRVPGSDDLSLPVCTSDAASAAGFDATYPFDESFRLERDYLEHAGRKKKARDRFSAFRGRLEEGQQTGVIFGGKGAYLKLWVELMTRNAVDTAPVGPPYPDFDFLVPFLMHHGVLESSAVNWDFALTRRLLLERDLQRDGATEAAPGMYWKDFFPKQVTLGDMPKSAMGLYQEWTVGRAKLEFDTLHLRPPSVVADDPDGNGKILSLATGYLRKTTSGNNFDSHSWPTHADARAAYDYVGDKDRLVGSPVAFHSHGISKIVFAFPKAYGTYKIPLPDGVAETLSVHNPDLSLGLKVERVERLPDRPGVVIIFVTPQEAYLGTGSAQPKTLPIQ